MFKQIIIDGITTDYIMYDTGEIFNTRTNNFISVYPIDKNHRYCRVKLEINGKHRTFGYHRLRMMVFSPVENMQNLQVNHIDGNRNNNELSNLEWTTGKENVRHAWRTGLCKSRRGENNNSHILTSDQVISICEKLMSGEPTTKISKEFGVSTSLIQSIRSKEEWVDISLRYNFPEKHGNARLTEQQVRNICEDILDGKSYSEIAKKYNLKEHYIKDFKSKKVWSKITSEYF